MTSDLVQFLIFIVFGFFLITFKSTSLESNFISLMVKKIVIGKIIKINKAIPFQTYCQEYKVKKKITKTGEMNSAVDNPNHAILNDFPLDLSKYLDIAVVEVWFIRPWPENLKKNIPKNKK